MLVFVAACCSALRHVLTGRYAAKLPLTQRFNFSEIFAKYKKRPSFSERDARAILMKTNVSEPPVLAPPKGFCTVYCEGPSVWDGYRACTVA
jgi:hypothetical protein